ncbi:DUF4446 family protein [Clostridium sp. MD294]|uniref:DUF4446 family protein n=1 Tax=Clostridium sp. MD294 TaxID=97138 RepID=UPI0002CA72E4|nr:DUF4446 family protein [Clostridium sp. MD294]NDO46285.1 DUF4446 family protein [Clostridium sp. MD294]USF29288.1 hypothetical protein C820_000673 [Clostridium sp. MD294]
MEVINEIIQFYLPFILAGLIVAVIILFSMCIVLFLKIGRERKRYDIFMGTNRRPDLNLEMKINAYFESVKEIEQKYGKLLDMVTDMDAIMSENIQKVGIVRYNPFDEMGGNLCFALALLDAKDNGVVLNGIHSRTGSFTYAKPIEMGVSTYVLSTEELQAVEIAQQNAYKRKAEKVVKVKPKKIFKWKDKPLFEPKQKVEQQKEKIEMIGDVTTNEKASIMAEEEIAQQISENTVIIKKKAEIENIKETVKELVKETIQMEKETQQSETEEKVRRLEEQVLLLTEKSTTENKVKKYHRPEPFQTEQFKIISEIEKISSDTVENEQEKNIDVISNSVEDIIERIAQKTEQQQKQFNQTTNKQIDEEQMVISAEQEIKTAVQKAIKNAAAITKEDTSLNEKSNKNSLGS